MDCFRSQQDVPGVGFNGKMFFFVFVFVSCLIVFMGFDFFQNIILCYCLCPNYFAQGVPRFFNSVFVFEDVVLFFFQEC